MPLDSVDYREKLLQLEIKSHMIPPELSNEQCQVLYKRLRRFDYQWIKESWQLLAILGDEVAYHNLDQQDVCGVNMAYYAAWSGNIERMNQVWVQRPELFSKPYADELGAAHYAARSGNPAALQWVKEKMPHFLEGSDRFVLAYFAARTGNPAMLQWIKDNKSHWLEIDECGFNLALGAANSGNPDVLRWVNKHLRDSLLAMDSHDRNAFLVEAATSGHEKQLSLALELSGDPQEINFQFVIDEKPQQIAILALLHTLQTNYTLTSVGYPCECERNSEIDALLQENKAIILKLNKLSKDFTVLCQQNTMGADASFLSKGILLTLFTAAAQAISSRIPEKDIIAKFNKIYNNSSNQLKHDVALEVKQEASRIKTSSAINKGRALLINEAWVELSAIILEQDPFTENDLRQWYLKYGETINQPVTPQTDSFFKPHETRPHALVAKLCKQFGFDEQRVTAEPKDEYAAGEKAAAARLC